MKYRRSVTLNDLINASVCDSEIEDCCSHACANCSNRTPLAILLDTEVVDEDEDITWTLWKTIGKKMNLQTVTGTIGCLLEEIDERWSVFLLHAFTNRQQRHYIKEIREQSSEGGFIVVQLDFAENYKFIRQREPQSAHWNTDQATLFTVHLKIVDAHR